MDPATRLKLRRLFRHRKRATESAFRKIAEGFDRNFIGRLGQFKKARRFAVGWLSLTVALIVVTIVQIINVSYAYQSVQPVAGGSYHEGMVGTFSTANPLYANGAVDTAVSRLVFAGLLRYDDQNQLAGDLAATYERDDTGKIYTVELRRNLTWHDDRPLTADDVVFTFQTLQNPDTNSPLRQSMQGVTITKIDSHKIKFTLSSALSSFPNSLTLGILPKHLLGSVPPVELRTSRFNTVNPVGAGPFAWRSLQLTEVVRDDDATAAIITLDRFAGYHTEPPELDRFVLHTYDSGDELISAFKKREVRAIAGMKSLPDAIKENDQIRAYSFQTTAEVMTFFNLATTSPLSDAAVRRGIMLGTSRRDVIKKLDQTLRVARQPILSDQFAFDARYQQPLYDKTLAAKTLDEAGWKQTIGGIREKDGKKLTFRLYAEENPDNVLVTKELKRQWREIGVDADVTLQQSMYFQTTLDTRSYDAVLYGISIGNDPDVYAYWHSSQTESGMNFSNYKSKTADTALEAARIRQDAAQRKLKYEAFLKAWQEDVPAIAMYHPRIYYVTRGTVYSLNEHVLNTDADRYYSVKSWQINTAMTNNH